MRSLITTATPGVDVDLGPAMKDGVEATRDLLAGKALRASVVGCPVNFREDDAKFQDTLKQLPDAAKFLAAIGCPRMVTWVLASYDQPKAEIWKLFTYRFGAIAKVLADHGIRFGLEYLGPLHHRTAKPHVFAHNMAEFLTLAGECGPNVGILFDTCTGTTLATLWPTSKRRESTALSTSTPTTLRSYRPSRSATTSGSSAVKA